MTAPKKKGSSKKNSHVTLKMVAERVGLTKGTCSAVLNKTAASRSVPLHTQERILAAAEHATVALVAQRAHRDRDIA